MRVLLSHSVGHRASRPWREPVSLLRTSALNIAEDPTAVGLWSRSNHPLPEQHKTHEDERIQGNTGQVCSLRGN